PCGGGCWLGPRARRAAPEFDRLVAFETPDGGVPEITVVLDARIDVVAAGGTGARQQAPRQTPPDQPQPHAPPTPFGQHYS
ncbi:MAG TPA: hypothetical protein VJU61_20705, partial [Polyangiaceae bacterium]|nr:hypothetical protein [Polyangiaceae bacterium]